MSIENEKFPQQEAPVKNTDHAFVQVGKDGQPVMPQTTDNKTEDNESTTVKEERQR